MKLRTFRQLVDDINQNTVDIWGGLTEAIERSSTMLSNAASASAGDYLLLGNDLLNIADDYEQMLRDLVAQIEDASDAAFVEAINKYC